MGWSSTENITASLGLTAEKEKFIIANSNLGACVNFRVTDIIKGALYALTSCGRFFGAFLADGEGHNVPGIAENVSSFT